jgi:hypothetical protein
MADERELCKAMIITICKELINKHPKLKTVDSNLFHFIIYDVAEKLNLPIVRGWYLNGPYCLAVDDILINMGMMDASQHQIFGKEKPMEYLIECKCHRRGEYGKQSK